MEQEIDIRKELETARAKARQIQKLSGDGAEIDAYWEVVCGDVLAAELALREQRGEWEIASLTRELLHYARQLEGYDFMLNSLYSAVSRMSKALYKHPRLKVELLDFFLLVVNRIEAQAGHELRASEDLSVEIRFMSRNIEFADKGQLDQIRDEGHLKHDPVEWTRRWEEVIDEANRIVDERLADHPRGMGYCNAYWFELADVLKEKFGIEWRCTAVMNTRVMFD